MSALGDPPAFNLASLVYGDGPAANDPAELLHEASKLQPALAPRQLRGLRLLQEDPGLAATAARSVRRHPALPRIPLPSAKLPPATLEATLSARRSVRAFAAAPLHLREVATLLFGGYGVTGGLPGDDRQPLRASPSAGALYPLELFLAAERVDGLDAGLYHYDPLRHELGHRPGRAELASLLPDPDMAGDPSAILFVTAVFWRSRFKYGLRAYRFTLLEAGHVAQNISLVATALGLGSLVLGGFYDGRVDALLQLNGVDESTLIAVCVGRTAPPA